VGVVALAARALALELLEVDFGQSLAIWPGCLQNMQCLSLMCHWRSSLVNLPSFPRWAGVSEEVGLAPEDLFALSELLFLLSFSLVLPLELDEAEVLPLVVELDEEEVEDLVWHATSDLCSQYLASMVCVRVW